MVADYVIDRVANEKKPKFESTVPYLCVYWWCDRNRINRFYGGKKERVIWFATTATKRKFCDDCVDSGHSQSKGAVGRLLEFRIFSLRVKWFAVASSRSFFDRVFCTCCKSSISVSRLPVCVRQSAARWTEGKRTGYWDVGRMLAVPYCRRKSLLGSSEDDVVIRSPLIWSSSVVLKSEKGPRKPSLAASKQNSSTPEENESCSLGARLSVVPPPWSIGMDAGLQYIWFQCARWDNQHANMNKSQKEL